VVDWAEIFFSVGAMCPENKSVLISLKQTQIRTEPSYNLECLQPS